MMKRFRVLLTILLGILGVLAFATPALGFCGFYVAKADTNLYNQASQVIIARDGNRTILTMANDYQGDVEEFAMVVPVPVLITEDQVNVGDPIILERLDSFSAPRLVEYFDRNPCEVLLPRTLGAGSRGDIETFAEFDDEAEGSLGVTVEARFTVGEYDILILSAKESDGLETWLNQNGYRIPNNASEILRPYIRQSMKFFVAKVNLDEYADTGFKSLRPLQIAYESPQFMLPIRLGMINAQGDQDLIVYLLSPKGQTELTNYRTVKVPSDVEIPEFVQQEFPDFYKAMFKTSYEQEQKKVAFLEYAWDMAWCDPCAANPLTPEELKKAGVFWITPGQSNPGFRQPNNVFLTRLHVRYSRNQFPEDLRFQETSNRQNFQGRYVIRHPYTGNLSCPQGETYRQQLQERQEREAQTLARLTRWDINDIRRKANLTSGDSRPWWRRVWD